MQLDEAMETVRDARDGEVGEALEYVRQNYDQADRDIVLIWLEETAAMRDAPAEINLGVNV